MTMYMKLTTAAIANKTPINTPEFMKSCMAYCA